MEEKAIQEKYDKILLLMVLDMTYEREFNDTYVEEEIFNRHLKDIRNDTSKHSEEYIKTRLISMMEEIVNELEG